MRAYGDFRGHRRGSRVDECEATCSHWTVRTTLTPCRWYDSITKDEKEPSDGVSLLHQSFARSGLRHWNPVRQEYHIRVRLDTQWSILGFDHARRCLHHLRKYS